MSIHVLQRSKSRRRVLLACVATVLTGVAMAPSVGAQANLRTTEISTGLNTFIGGRLALLTVAETGPAGSSSNVTLSLYDEKDRLLARKVGVVSRARPVALEFTLPTSPKRVKLRGSVQFVMEDGGSSDPAAGLESFDPFNLTIEPRVFCAPGSGRTDPETLCPGWAVTSVTTIE
jgi:hypothetical protein